MFDENRIVRVGMVAVDQAGATHINRIKRALGLRSDDEAIAWALGIAAGRMPTNTEMKRSRQLNAFLLVSAADVVSDGVSARGFLEL